MIKTMMFVRFVYANSFHLFGFIQEHKDQLFQKASHWPFGIYQKAGAKVVWISAEKLSSNTASLSI